MKRNFKSVFYLMLLLIAGSAVFGQEERNHYIGINLFQIPATTLDLVYEFSYNPRFTMVVNSGFTINYANSFDYVGFFLTPHYKCGNYGYAMKNQSGGFVKIGMKFNFKKEAEKKSHFYLGAFMANSLIYEKAEYENLEIPNSEVEYLNHNLFIIGITGAAGYNFRISDRFNSDFVLHISMPTKNYKDLYGYRNYIPGMGFMETCSNERIFPMLVLNVKYKLR